HRWNVRTGQREAPGSGHEISVRDIHFTPDGEHVVSEDDHQGFFWDNSGKLLTHTPEDARGAISPDGRWMAVLRKGLLQFVDRKSGEIRHSIKIDESANSQAFSPDGRYHALVGHAGAFSCIRVREVAGGRLVHQFDEPGNSGRICFTPDGK